MIKSIPYTTDIAAVNMGLKARGLQHTVIIDRVVTLAESRAEDEESYECTCCYDLQEGHQEHCGTWLNDS